MSPLNYDISQCKAPVRECPVILYKIQFKNEKRFFLEIIFVYLTILRLLFVYSYSVAVALINRADNLTLNSAGNNSISKTNETLHYTCYNHMNNVSNSENSTSKYYQHWDSINKKRRDYNRLTPIEQKILKSKNLFWGIAIAWIMYFMIFILVAKFDFTN